MAKFFQDLNAGRYGAAAILPVLLSACAHEAAFPRELFTVQAIDPEYPVMMSRVAAQSTPGRPVHAESGQSASASSSTYSIGDSTVIVHQSQSSSSELSASAKLAAQVKRSDRLVGIEQCVFDAENMSSYGFSSQKRTLAIEARAYR